MYPSVSNLSLRWAAIFSVFTTMFSALRRRCLHLLDSQDLRLFRPSFLLELLWLRLTSHDKSCFNQVSPSVRPPRVRAITFIPCNCCIYCRELGQYWILFCKANSSIPIQPCIQFLFVSSGLCLRLPSDSTSRWTPLPFANSSYCQVCSGLSPPSYSPCRAHY
jgi:hypothetical protein